MYTLTSVSYTHLDVDKRQVRKEVYPMLKIFKYMKKSAASIVLVFLLLVVQAICDLSLPDFTSDIVNVGIQQSGIKNAAPDVIRQSEYDKLSLFLGTADKETVDSHYRLLDRSQLSDKEVASLSKKYPVLAEEPLYPVSYTHLDVYKRQEHDGEAGGRPSGELPHS